MNHSEDPNMQRNRNEEPDRLAETSRPILDEIIPYLQRSAEKLRRGLTEGGREYSVELVKSDNAFAFRVTDLRTCQRHSDLFQLAGGNRGRPRVRASA